MYGLGAFEASVGAYPSITLIQRGPARSVRTAKATSTDPAELTVLANALMTGSAAGARTPPALASGEAPWLLPGGTRQEAVWQLEERCPTLQAAGCGVGIGVDTGADKVFVAPYAGLPVEEGREFPLAINRDVSAGRLSWHGMGVW
jgi:hypothetical protein